MAIFFHARSTEFGAYNPKALQADSVSDIFSDLPRLVGRIPEEDRWDFYYTLAETKTPRKKDGDGQDRGAWAKENWIQQEVLAWDIDHIADADLPKVELYAEAVAEFVGCSPEDMTIVASGHGFHFIFFLSVPITDYRFFEKNRPFYKASLDEIGANMKKRGLSGEPDHRVFDYARILRLPMTENRKDPKAPKACRLIQSNLLRHSINLRELLGIPETDASEGVTDASLKTAYRNPDVEGILSGCDFLRWVEENPLGVKEPEGYAALSILTRLDSEKESGLELSKRFYREWKSSSSLMRADPDRKIDQAMRASNPRRCTSINGVFKRGCAGCKYYGLVDSPMGIARPDFIASEKDGFYRLVRDEETGRLKKSNPQYNDLLRAFIRDHEYFYQAAAKQLWLYNGSYYEAITDAEVKAYAEAKFDPKPTETMRTEFVAKVKANRIRGNEDASTFFVTTIKGKVNMANGVFDTKTRTLSPHGPQYGFRYKLPYTYDPGATAPLFTQFLFQITVGRQIYQDVIMDAIAAILTPGYDTVDAAFWWFQGEGENGKSVLLKTIEGLVGRTNCAYLKANDLAGDQGRFRLTELDGRLLCVMEEINEKALGSQLFGVLKDLSSGGTITVERKGKDPYKIANAAKLIFTANNAPILEDTSHAVKRRFIPVPFELDLNDPACAVKKDTRLVGKLLGELPGIFNMALVAMDAMIARGIALQPTESKALVFDMVLDSDSIERWIFDRIELSANESDTVFVSEGYADYCQYMAGENPVSKNTFGRRMKAKMKWRGCAHPTRRGDTVAKAYRGMKFKGGFKAAF